MRSLHPWTLACYAILLFTAVRAQYTAQIETHWYQPTGLPRAVAEDAANNTVYIGGDFNSVKPPFEIGRGADLSMATGAADIRFKIPNDQVNAVVSDGNGGWFIAGIFVTVGDSSRTKLAHVGSDGNASAWNANLSFSTTISCLLLKGDTLIVGGAFTQFGGVARSGVALVHRQTGQVLGMNAMTAGGSNWVSAMALIGDVLFVGGSFTSAMGQPRSNLCAIVLSVGALAPWDPGTVGRVRTMAIDGGALYIGGEFTSAGGSPRTRLAALDLVTGAPWSFNPGANNTVWALAISNGQVYVGGQFSMIGGQTRNKLAQVSTTGVLGAWNPDLSAFAGTVWALIIMNSTIYAGGTFSTVNGIPRVGLAALGEPGSSVPFITAWDPGCTGSILALAAHNGRIYAGGQYINIGILKRSRLAAFDITTGEPTAWNPGADGSVFVLAIGTDVVYAGGNFTQLGGAPRMYLGAVNRTNDAATAWNPAPSAPPYALLMNGSTLYAGGHFTQIGGAARSRLAELSTATGAATPWNVEVSGQVKSILRSNDTLFFAGAFQQVNGISRSNLASVLTSTGAVTSFNPSADNTVNAIAKSGNRIYAIGYFNTIGGQSAPFNIAAVNSVTGIGEPWVSPVGGPLAAIAASDHAVYHCGNGTGLPLAVYGLSPVDGAVNGFSVPAVTNDVTDIAIGANNRIYFVGLMDGGTSPNYNYSFHSAIEVPDVNPLDLRVFLEGPYDIGTGLMTDALRTLPSFPSTEPFTALGYAHVGGGGGETCSPAVLAVTGNNAIVDWVLVELRDPLAPAVRLYSMSALLQRDGDIVGMNGASGLVFNAPAGNYHVAVRHRNHLGVMTSEPVPLTAVDFTSSTTDAYGNGARKTMAGVEVLWAGDVNFDGLVRYTGANNDRDPILVAIGGNVPTNTIVGQYRQEDVDLGATVKYTGTNNDRDPILVNIGGSVPTDTRVAQLP
ncbi:MAG: hypothetical protein ABI599_11295 [Flavobacteriales bacterium]